MGILPIGFFSPLPLAMMIPFMATQSLAMGEAFGKSFQYGKRKISSMTNEEFNKLTFRDLMVEQTANINAIIPELNKQMAASQAMQTKIFQEMINLVPAFFESFKTAINPELLETGVTHTSGQASPPPSITNIRYTTDRDFELQQDRINAAIDLFNKNFLEQRGDKESLELKLNPPTEEHDTSAAHHNESNLFKNITSSQKEAALGPSLDFTWQDWSKKLAQLKIEYQTADTIVKETKPAYDRRRTSGQTNAQAAEVVKYNTYLNRRRATASKIRMMSNAYRDPNNNIRKNALQLRQAIAGGRWN